MIEKQTLIDCLQTDYDIEVETILLLSLGADIDACVYRAVSHDQTPYFVKVKRNTQHDMGLAIVELLYNAGIEQIIPAIKTRSGKLAQRIGDFSLTVYPFVEGQDGFNCKLTDTQWIELGKALRQVHEIEVPSSIQQQLRRETYSPKWRQIVRSLYSLIAAEPVGDTIAIKLLQFMKANMPAIRQLVDRAEELGAKLAIQSHPSVLCHSDIHGGNVLIQEHGPIYIVDWDDPIIAPKERDLMFIGGGVANVWNKPDEVHAFYKGYGETTIDPTILAYYRHERIVEDIAVYGQELLLKATESEEARQEMYNHFIDMFTPRGVVNIAFETDEELSI